MPANIEIKARVADLDGLRRAVLSCSDQPVQILDQEDVFFNGANGRLKLRIFPDNRGELIQYERSDQSGPKQSSYAIARSSDANQFRDVLERAYGELIVVKKRRELYLCGQTRIHLDEVEGLATFMELEVVLERDQSPAEGETIARDLMARLGIAEVDLVTCAYADLLLNRTPDVRHTATIRTAQLDDLEAIVEIYNQAVSLKSVTADTEPVSIDSRRPWFHAHPPQRYPIWVAVSEGSLAGWCSLSPYRPGRAALRHTAEISYYVNEGHRRQGIASQLIAHALENSPELDLKTLFALVLGRNAASCGLLEKLGFRLWGRLPRVADFDGEECDHLIFGRRIG